MVTNEFVKLLETMSEVLKPITDAIQELANSLSEIFNSPILTKEKTHKIENGYYKPEKNYYLKSKTNNLYKVERRVQKHLPYQRRSY